MSDFLCSVVDATNFDVSSINYSQAIAIYSQCPLTPVYFVLDPKSDYFDPFDCFTESFVERAVDKFFSLETLYIVEDSVGDYDRDKIAFSAILSRPEIIAKMSICPGMRINCLQSPPTTKKH